MGLFVKIFLDEVEIKKVYKKSFSRFDSLGPVTIVTALTPFEVHEEFGDKKLVSCDDVKHIAKNDDANREFQSLLHVQMLRNKTLNLQLSFVNIDGFLIDYKLSILTSDLKREEVRNFNNILYLTNATENITVDFKPKYLIDSGMVVVLYDLILKRYPACISAPLNGTTIQNKNMIYNKKKIIISYQSGMSSYQKKHSLPVDYNTFDHQTGCDLVLIVEGVKLFCHQVVITAHSEILKELVNNDLNTFKEIYIEHFSVESIRELLRYMYSGIIQCSGFQSIKEVLKAAIKYAVTDVISFSEEFMLRNLSVKNVRDIVCFAEAYNCQAMKTEAMNFMFQKMKEIHQ